MYRLKSEYTSAALIYSTFIHDHAYLHTYKAERKCGQGRILVYFKKCCHPHGYNFLKIMYIKV